MSSLTLLLCDDHHVLYRSGTRRVAQAAVRHPLNPVLAPTEPWEMAIAWSSIHRDPASGRYQLWYQAFSGDRAQERTHRCVVCYAESDDGLHFDKPDLGLFSYNGIGRTNIVLVGCGGYSDRYANSVVVDTRDSDPGRRYKMAYYDFESSAGEQRPGVCVAFRPMASTGGSTRRDGLAWHRPFRQEFFLRRNADDSFDSGSLFTNSTPVMLAKEMRFYYGAYSQGATSANNYTHASGIGLAVLPRDRLAGIGPADSSDQMTLGDAVEGVGQVTLRPVDLASCAAVVVNADATAGSVRVEILDAQGRRLRGFTRGDALPLEGDALDHVARWRGKTLADLPEGPHLLRLHLTEAVVYAVSLPAITEA